MPNATDSILSSMTQKSLSSVGSVVCGAGQRRPSMHLQSQVDWAENNAVYIFSVGPWVQYIRRGPHCYDVPACAAGKPYSAPVKIPGIVTEDYPDSETTMKMLQYDGYQTALDLIGVGIGMTPQESLLRFGVAVSRQWPPSQEDLDKANARLDQHCSNLVGEMNQAYSEGPAAARITFQARYHNAAADRLKRTKVDCPWYGSNLATASERMACPFCGEAMAAQLPKCPNCKEIVNQTAYKAAQAEARGLPA